jgi:hypothetical protein
MNMRLFVVIFLFILLLLVWITESVNYLSTLEVQPDVVESVQDAIDDETTRKYYNLHMESEKPLHDKTKHSKLGAIVHLYNLTCMGGITLYSHRCLSSSISCFQLMVKPCQKIYMRPKNL